MFSFLPPYPWFKENDDFMRSPFYLAKQISCSRATFAAPVQLSYKINLIVTSRPIIHTNHKFVTEER